MSALDFVISNFQAHPDDDTAVNAVTGTILALAEDFKECNQPHFARSANRLLARWERATNDQTRCKYLAKLRALASALDKTSAEQQKQQ